MRNLFAKLIKKFTPSEKICQAKSAIKNRRNRKDSLVTKYYGVVAFPVLFIIAVLAAFNVITITDIAFKLLILATLPLIAKYRHKKQGSDSHPTE